MRRCDGFNPSRTSGSAREWMTGEVNAAIAGIRAAGPAEILVCDSHGNGQSVLIDKLPDDVRIVRGFPRPLTAPDAWSHDVELDT